MKFGHGWIKTHRKILKSDICFDNHRSASERFHLWMWILMNANIFESKIKHGDKEVTIPPGSLAYSYNYIATDIGFTVKKVRNIIDYLRRTERITVSTAYNGSYLIVRKWEEYQIDNASGEELRAESRASKGQSLGKQRASKGQQTEECKNERMEEQKKSYPKRKRRSAAKKQNAVHLDFLSGELQEFISGVSDEIRLRWMTRYCKQTISDKLQAAQDWSIAKGKKPRNVALLMNTFFRDTGHDKWKDEPGGMDPDQKELSERLNSLLEQGMSEVKGNA